MVIVVVILAVTEVVIEQMDIVRNSVLMEQLVSFLLAECA
jgi:hypothetical protein